MAPRGNHQIQRQRTAGADQIAQGCSLEVLHGQIGDSPPGSAGDPEVCDVDDVRMTKAPGRFRFATKALQRSAVLDQRRKNRLNGHSSTRAHVLGLVHRAHAALSDETHDAVLLIEQMTKQMMPSDRHNRRVYPIECRAHARDVSRPGDAYGHTADSLRTRRRIDLLWSLIRSICSLRRRGHFARELEGDGETAAMICGTQTTIEAGTYPLLLEARAVEASPPQSGLSASPTRSPKIVKESEQGQKSSVGWEWRWRKRWRRCDARTLRSSPV